MPAAALSPWAEPSQAALSPWAEPSQAALSLPAKLSVQDGLASATIVFGSGNYDYMKVEDVRYDAELTGGRSAFTIPVAYFDWKMPVIANTIAMSTPHEIAYTLSFDAASIVPAEQ